MGHRLRGAAISSGIMRAGIPSLVCVEVKGTPTPEILEDQLVENCVREDLKPIEQARGVQGPPRSAELLRTGNWPMNSISRIDRGQAMALLELPGRYPGEGRCGVIPASAASERGRIGDRPKPAGDHCQGRVRRDRPATKWRPPCVRDGRAGRPGQGDGYPTERRQKSDGLGPAGRSAGDNRCGVEASPEANPGRPGEINRGDAA